MSPHKNAKKRYTFLDTPVTLYSLTFRDIIYVLADNLAT